MDVLIPFSDLLPMTREVRRDVDFAWLSMLERGDFVRGEAVARFEREWAAYCQVRHAVGVGNGTDALWAALVALGIGPGDEVIVPANTFVASVEAIVHAGARPRFADVEPDTLLMSAATLSAAITPAVRAVIVVHLYGQMPDMTAIAQVAAAADIFVVEDAAQAHGATWRGRRAGSFGAVGCFSFYPGKNLGAFGDAGAVVTDDSGIAATIRSIVDHGRSAENRQRHDLIGVNSRLDTVQAGVLSAKLQHLERWNESRRAIAAAYRELLEEAPVQFVAELPDSKAVYHLGVVQIEQRAWVRRSLQAGRIETGIHYLHPCHVLAPYARYADGELPVVEAASRRIVSLPLYPHMTFDQVERVADVLRCAVTGVRRD